MDGLRVDVPVNTHYKGYEQELEHKPEKLDCAFHIYFVHQKCSVMVDVVFELGMVHEFFLFKVNILSYHWHDHLVSQIIVQLPYSDGFYYPEIFVSGVGNAHEVAPGDQGHQVKFKA